jgi:hypothetical protein
MPHASGGFEVKLTPQTEAGKSPLARILLDKQYGGELEAKSRGEMLAASTGVKGSAGYVAMEEVNGTLNRRAGSFVLQHNGTMDRGAPRLAIAVVPDSGTGELAGLVGTVTISITGGKHFYDFEYTLPESQ